MSWTFFYVQWFEVRGLCSFCWYQWNCWPSLLNFLFIKLEKNKKLHTSVEQPRKWHIFTVDLCGYFWPLTFDLHLTIPHLRSNLWQYPTTLQFEWQMVHFSMYTCTVIENIRFGLECLMPLSTIFHISWRSVLLVEETSVPGKTIDLS